MNEFDLIQSYFNWRSTDPNVVLGVGDDAALFDLESDHQLVTSTDTLVEDIHFFRETSPSDIAYKSLAVNLSDIAAMGAIAKCFTLSLTLPKINHGWLKEFSASLKKTSRLYNVNLIGGDTTKGSLNITITMMGSIKKGKSIQRSGARNEDDIYISGDLGTAALCLKKMNEGIKPSLNELNKLNRPIPRLELGAALKDLASSCIDVSDGLEQDLSHILNSSDVGATIDAQKLPLGEELSQYIKETNDWSLPLCGGDDYELCFTADKASRSKLKSLSKTLNIRVTKIGSINASNELKINGYDGPRASYQHF
jgi:thiamine-monophosphate kinase